MGECVSCRGSTGEGEWREYSWKDVLAGDHPHPEQVSTWSRCCFLTESLQQESTLECCNRSPIINQDELFFQVSKLLKT